MTSPLTDTLLKTVKWYIQAELPCTFADKILVGLSGGADSVALLDLLHRLGYPCIAAHCNFQLRGAEADRDHAFSRQLAHTMAIPFCDVRFDTHPYAAQKGISIEMACRELRYEWFEQMRITHEASYIAVAHHGDDAIETLFLNMIRGTGIAGMVGIRPQNGKIIRPLLCLVKTDIEAYLHERGLDYVTDSSNLEDIYQRNKIRNQIIPQLKTINSAVTDTLLRTMGHLQEAEKVYRAAIGQQLKQLIVIEGDEQHMDMKLLLQMPSPISCLHEWLAPWGFNTATCEEIRALLLAPMSGKQFYSPQARLIIDRTTLILSTVPLDDANRFYSIDQEEKKIDIPISLTFDRKPFSAEFVIPRTSDYATFDAELLSYPLVLRRWMPGDRFRPFGMKGYKKVSDYFSDQKFSLLQKESAWLLCSGNEIIWIVGHRCSDYAKIVPETQQVLVINVNNH